MKDSTAPADPLFWLHHAKVDRIWESWRSRNPGRNHQIQTVITEIGMLVSVTLVTTIDRGSTTSILVAPTVNLPSSKNVSIRAEGITAIHRFSIAPQVASSSNFAPNMFSVRLTEEEKK